MDALQGHGTVRFRKESPLFKHCAPSLAPSLPTFCFPRPTNSQKAIHSFIPDGRIANEVDDCRGRGPKAKTPRLTHSLPKRESTEKGNDDERTRYSKTTERLSSLKQKSFLQPLYLSFQVAVESTKG